MKKTVNSNHRVEVFPIITRYLRPANVTPEECARKDIVKALNDLVEALKRHNDFESLAVRYDSTDVCSHCGAIWTEVRADYNGGCCDKDEGAEEARIAHEQEASAMRATP